MINTHTVCVLDDYMVIRLCTSHQSPPTNGSGVEILEPGRNRKVCGIGRTPEINLRAYQNARRCATWKMGGGGPEFFIFSYTPGGSIA
jgi:hypothetical protein